MSVLTLSEVHQKLTDYGIKQEALSKLELKDAMELWLFDTAPAAIADNAPFVVSAADLETCLGVVAIAAADFKDEATKAVATLKNVGLPYKLPVGSSDLIGYLVTRGTPTYTGTDNLSIRLGILQD